MFHCHSNTSGTQWPASPKGLLIHFGSIKALDPNVALASTVIDCAHRPVECEVMYFSVAIKIKGCAWRTSMHSGSLREIVPLLPATSVLSQYRTIIIYRCMHARKAVFTIAPILQNCRCQKSNRLSASRQAKLPFGVLCPS